MEPPVIDPARAADMAERLLDALNEVRSVVSVTPVYEGQFVRIRDLLAVAQTVVDEAVPMPPYRHDGNETSISREGMKLMLDGEIARLADLKIAARLHLTRGDAFTAQPWRVFVSAAVAVRSLLAAPNISPREEVGGDERDPAAAFHG